MTPLAAVAITTRGPSRLSNRSPSEHMLVARGRIEMDNDQASTGAQTGPRRTPASVERTVRRERRATRAVILEVGTSAAATSAAATSASETGRPVAAGGSPARRRPRRAGPTRPSHSDGERRVGGSSTHRARPAYAACPRAVPMHTEPGRACRLTIASRSLPSATAKAWTSSSVTPACRPERASDACAGHTRLRARRGGARRGCGRLTGGAPELAWNLVATAALLPSRCNREPEPIGRRRTAGSRSCGGWVRAGQLMSSKARAAESPSLS